MPAKAHPEPTLIQFGVRGPRGSDRCVARKYWLRHPGEGGCQEILPTNKSVVRAPAGTQGQVTEIPRFPLSRERRAEGARAGPAGLDHRLGRDPPCCKSLIRDAVSTILPALNRLCCGAMDPGLRRDDDHASVCAGMTGLHDVGHTYGNLCNEVLANRCDKSGVGTPSRGARA
jgi:hypothetical protein